MFLLPTVAIAIGGRAAWTVALAAWLLSAGATWVIAVASSQYPGIPFPAYLDRGLGPVLGRSLTAVGALFCMLAAASDLMLMYETLDGIFLPRTPAWAIFSAILLTAGYGAVTGWRSIARVAPLFLSPLVFLTLVLLIFILPLSDTGQLRPVLDPGNFAWQPLIALGGLTGFHYPLLAPYLYQRVATPGRFLRHLLFGAALGGLGVLLFTLLPVMVMGPGAARAMRQPFPDISAVVVVHRSFFDRPEHFIRLSFNVSALLAVSTALLACGVNLAYLFGARTVRGLTAAAALAAGGIAYAAFWLNMRQELYAATGVVGYAMIPWFGAVAWLGWRRNRQSAR